MPYPGIGVGVYIKKSDKVLLGLRKGGHQPGSWCAPGGKLEMFESWEHCALRETTEETGLRIKNLRMIGVTDDPHPPLHFITIAFSADWESGEATLVEPDKFIEWGWFLWNDLPTPLFIPTQNFVNLGIHPFD